MSGSDAARQEQGMEGDADTERWVNCPPRQAHSLTELVAGLMDPERGEDVVVGHDPRLPLLLCPARKERSEPHIAKNEASLPPRTESHRTALSSPYAEGIFSFKPAFGTQ